MWKIFGTENVFIFQTEIMTWFNGFESYAREDIKPLRLEDAKFKKITYIIHNHKDLNCIFTTDNNEIMFSDQVSDDDIKAILRFFDEEYLAGVMSRIPRPREVDS